MGFDWFGRVWFEVADIGAVAEDNNVVFGDNFDVEISINNASDSFADEIFFVFIGIFVVESKFVTFEVALNIGDSFVENGFA